MCLLILKQESAWIFIRTAHYITISRGVPNKSCLSCSTRDYLWIRDVGVWVGVYSYTPQVIVEDAAAGESRCLIQSRTC